jgi:serine/threonine protein kinase
MPLNSIPFLDSEIPLPFRFNFPLPFSYDDKKEMSWLKNETRYYGVKEEINRGGRAIALEGFVSDKKGIPLENSPRIVLKVPNLDIHSHTLEQIKEYLNRLNEEGGREWQLTRKRLYGCIYANPIFDFNVDPKTYLDQYMPLPITAQLFLDNASSLDDYLLKTGQRQEKYKSEKGVPIDNWTGMSSPDKWIQLARGLATGLADIHKRRVVHGDIWPPNIFIKENENKNPFPVFIDFGEAFPIEPQGDLKKQQRDHAYRAPERSDSQSIVTEQADVYSFGKLLLHLAVGEEPILSPDYRGHRRREIIREKFITRNHLIASENPFIVDIICKCVSYDPVKRPSMREVLRALNTYVDPKSYSISIPKVSDKLNSLRSTWTEITTELSSHGSTVDPFLEEILERKLDEIQDVMKELSSDVINLIDTREGLISALVGLFARLREGDRYLSVTSPRMWQGTALGLDGRYLTATERATARGASIQRAFIFSIQEVGDKWALDLAERLENLSESEHLPMAKELADSIKCEVKNYLAENQHKEGSLELSKDVQFYARERLILVMKSYWIVSEGVCRDKFDKSKFSTSKNCTGLYLGLIPVSTLDKMRTRKSAHPVSVFFFNAANDTDQYLLMMTDCTSRGAFGRNGNSSEDIAYQSSKPELRGIKVFKSVLGVPQNRIKELEKIFQESINVGGWIDKLYRSFPAA